MPASKLDVGPWILSPDTSHLYHYRVVKSGPTYSLDVQFTDKENGTPGAVIYRYTPTSFNVSETCQTLAQMMLSPTPGKVLNSRFCTPPKCPFVKIDPVSGRKVK